MIETFVWLEDPKALEDLICGCGQMTFMWLWLDDLYVVVVRGLVCGRGQMTCMWLWLEDLYVVMVR